MRKLFLALLFLCSPCYSAPTIGGSISGTSTANIIIAASGSNEQICLNHVSVDISVFGNNTATIRMLDGATTNYSLIVSSQAGYSFSPVILNFGDSNPWCSSTNKSLTISNSATTFDINYNGFIRQLK